MAGNAVNAFAEKVGVAIVAGVFLDHVDVIPPHRRLAARSTLPR
jgi:hypothetical protein